MSQVLIGVAIAIVLAVLLSTLREAIRSGEFSYRLDAFIRDSLTISRAKHPATFWFTFLVHSLLALVLLVLVADILGRALGVGGIVV